VIVRLTLRYTTPDIHCTDRRYECDGGIMRQTEASHKFLHHRNANAVF